MKKYFLILFILFAAFINFRGNLTDYLQSPNGFTHSSEVFGQNSEEDCAVLESNGNISDISAIIIVIKECNPSIERCSDIWKPPVNA